MSGSIKTSQRPARSRGESGQALEGAITSIAMFLLAILLLWFPKFFLELSNTQEIVTFGALAAQNSGATTSNGPDLTTDDTFSGPAAVLESIGFTQEAAESVGNSDVNNMVGAADIATATAFRQGGIVNPTDDTAENSPTFEAIKLIRVRKHDPNNSDPSAGGALEGGEDLITIQAITNFKWTIFLATMLFSVDSQVLGVETDTQLAGKLGNIEDTMDPDGGHTKFMRF